MDRISALRNVEDALTAFEDGDVDLAGLEREVRGVLRTYATDFDGDLTAYRATGDGPADGVVVLAQSRQGARERVRNLVDDHGDFSVAKHDPADNRTTVDRE
ncbi:MAG: hypothetical protein ABEJ85_01115 [Haloarculaceae archaeon]